MAKWIASDSRRSRLSWGSTPGRALKFESRASAAGDRCQSCRSLTERPLNNVQMPAVTEGWPSLDDPLLTFAMPT